MCLLYDGSTRRLTESGFMEKPGIEPATPGLQGIVLIHYTTGAFIGEIFTYKKHPIHRNSLAMVINMHFLCQYIVTDIKQTCLGQGLGVKITARKRTSEVKNLGHTSDLYIYRSLVIRCLVVKIEHLQVTVDVVSKPQLKQLR